MFHCLQFILDFNNNNELIRTQILVDLHLALIANLQ